MAGDDNNTADNSMTGRLKSVVSKVGNYISTIGDTPSDTARKAAQTAAGKQNKADTDLALGKGTDNDLSKANTGIVATRGTHPNEGTGYRKGLKKVAVTGRKLLHKGERVLTKSESKNYSKSKGMRK